MNTLNIDELLKSSGTSEQRIQSIFHLLFDDSNKSIDILNKVLEKDPSPIVRHEAAYILGEKENKLAVKPLIDAIESDTHKIVIHEAALALANLGKLGYPESEKILQHLLDHPDGDVADTAQIAIQRLQMKLNSSVLDFTLDNLRSTISDFSLENKENRIQASFLLMDDASTESIDILLMAINKEPSPIVKHELIFSLGECIDYRVVPELIKILNTEKNFFTVHESLLALGTLGDMRAEDSIRSYLHHEDAGIAESAEIALERLIS